MFTLIRLLMVGVQLMTTIYLPVIATGGVRFQRGLIVSCLPNAGITYADGYVLDGLAPVDGLLVGFSTQLDGPLVASIRTGPHQGYPNWNHGFWSHILGISGPRKGDWYFWVMNDKGTRDSVVVKLHTDGVASATSCQQARITFNTQ